MHKIAFIAWILLSTYVHAADKIKMAITVDDLPVHGGLPPGVERIDIARKYLAALKKHHVPEVYGYVNAEKMEHDAKLVEVLKAWREAGYPLGNHTWDHQDLIDRDVEAYKRGITKDEPILKKLSAGEEYKSFRYPFLHEGGTLEARNNVRNFLKSNGYQIAEVSVDFNDWAWRDAYPRCVGKKDEAAIEWMKKLYLQSAAESLDRSVLAAKILWDRPISHILLLHIGALDAEIMDELLSLYESKGVEFISLTEALKDPVYAYDSKNVADEGNTILQLAARTMKKEAFAPHEGLPWKKIETICQ